MIGRYIYAIIDFRDDNDFRPRGKDFGTGVYFIRHGEISAAVSDSEITDFTCMRKDALARQLINHQKAAERIMEQGYTVIPVRLGTFGKDDSEVRHILARAYPAAKEIFKEIKEKIEIDLAVVWSDFNAVIKEAGEEREIKEFKERFQANPAGVTVDDRMKIGVMVKDALDKKREQCGREIQEALEPIGFKSKTHELMDDKMVINTAYLIDKTRQKDFEKAVERLNAGFNDRLDFKCIGPLPPYSFYTLEIKNMEFKDIEWACKRLGISASSITGDEIKKAYHRQAFASHPDKNLKNPHSQEEFNEANRAYEVLLEYCQACRQSGSPPFSLDEKQFKENALLVKVRE